VECVLTGLHKLRTEVTCGLLVIATPTCSAYVSEVKAIIGIKIKMCFRFRGYELYVIDLILLLLNFNVF